MIEGLTTLEALVFFCRLALRVDQQDLGYIFDICSNLVRLTRTEELIITK